MARTNGNTDSGIESDAECEPSAVPLVVDFGVSVITSRHSSSMASSVVSSVVGLSSVHHCNGVHSSVTTDDTLSSSVASTPTSSSSGAPNEDIPVITTAEHHIPTAPETTPETTLETTPETTADDSDDNSRSFRLCLSSGLWLTISLEQISDYESSAMQEFFDGQTKGKTPDSYRQIRNHFLRHWTQTRPKRFGYHEILRKVGHLHLGNVTAFSRVQKFLESHKAINTSKPSKSEFSSAAKRPKAAPKRAPDQSPEVRRAKRPNPFKLVPLDTFAAHGLQPPFQVRLSVEALAVVDIHAHCVRTEVIGLLGGHFCRLSRTLAVLTAEPCASLDDHDLQCDMEPVSQAIAKERLEEKRLQCVGWYHSHPTFVPNPSVRDLETQSQFQTLFARDGQPFVALILSPYVTSSERQQALHSPFKCLWVSDKQQAEYAVPMELPALLVRKEKLHFQVLQKVHDLCRKIQGHASRVTLRARVKRFREVNHLDKLCHSLRHYLLETGLSGVECDHLLANCRHVLLKHLDDATTPATTATTTVH